MLDKLGRAVQADLAPDRRWLLSTAVSRIHSTAEDVLAGVRFFYLAPPVKAALWLLEHTLAHEVRSETAGKLLVVSVG